MINDNNENSTVPVAALFDIPIPQRVRPVQTGLHIYIPLYLECYTVKFWDTCLKNTFLCFETHQKHILVSHETLLCIMCFRRHENVFLMRLETLKCVFEACVSEFYSVLFRKTISGFYYPCNEQTSVYSNNPGEGQHLLTNSAYMVYLW